MLVFPNKGKEEDSHLRGGRTHDERGKKGKDILFWKSWESFEYTSKII